MQALSSLAMAHKWSALAAVALCVLAAAGVAPGPAAPYLTSLSGARLQAQPPIAWVPAAAAAAAAAAADADIALDRSRALQRMLGFGSALTESAAYNYAQLSGSLQQRVLDLLYAPPPAGNGYALGRLHMNSADFSLSSYNLDNVTGDLALAAFDAELARDSEYVVPFARAASSRAGGALKLFFSPWSPPGWMKASGSMINSSWPSGLRPEPSVHAAWALYFVKFAQALQRKGLAPWGLTIQNEPLMRMTNPAHLYEACAYTAQGERDFLRDYLGPALAAANLSDLVVMAFDWNKGQLAAYVNATLADAGALRYLGGAAVHWYAWRSDLFLDQLAALAALPGWDASRHVLLATEACYIQQGVAAAAAAAAEGGAPGNDGTGVLIGPGPPPGAGSVAVRYGVGELYLLDALGDIVFGAQGYVDWNALLDYSGGPNHLGRADISAPILADAATGSLYVQSPYYYMGQLSRFVPPGWVRVGAAGAGVAAANADFNALKLHIEQNLPGAPASKPPAVGLCAAAAFASPDGAQGALVVLNVLPRAFGVLVRDGAWAFNATLPPRSAMTFVWST